MPIEPPPTGPALPRRGLTLLPALLLAACATAPAPTAAPLTAPSPSPASTAAMAEDRATPPAPPAEPAPAAPAPFAALALRPAPAPAEAVLAYADRVRGLPAPELAAEIQRLGESSYSPLRAVQLAIASAQARTGGQLPRAQTLLQRVLAQQDAEAQALHPLARLLSVQYAELRRLDEQAERQARELREAQRRIELLNDRLEAVRAIERSLPTRQRRDVPAPGAPGRPPND